MFTCTKENTLFVSPSKWRQGRHCVVKKGTFLVTTNQENATRKSQCYVIPFSFQTEKGAWHKNLGNTVFGGSP